MDTWIFWEKTFDINAIFMKGFPEMYTAGGFMQSCMGNSY